MATSKRSWQIWAAAALAVAPALGAIGGDDAGDPKRPAPAGDRAEAAAIARALQDFGAAVRKEQGAVDSPDPGSSKAPGVDRPARTVTPTTITPADLDRLIDEYLAASKSPKANPTSDEEFIRRVSLDLTGKLPTTEAALEFARSKGRDKRVELIDRLLEDRATADHWARYWRDVVQYRATVENPGLIRFPLLEGWLAEQFGKNRPWDEMAAEMIAAEGPPEENGAAVFLLAQSRAQPVEIAGEVSRIFMGVQIACAQCHDHPTDPWKREQFHEFAAFFAGTRAVRNPKAEQGRGFMLTSTNNARYTMPDLEDPKKSIPVEPKFFLDDSAAALPKGMKPQQRRELVASYVTGQDNPWFARAFVNRAWYTLMGEAFYNPVDDMGPAREATAAAILEPLADQWQKGGYDVRWLYRTILNTKAYQRDVRSTNSAAGRTPFASNCPSRLSGDQIFEALGQALGVPLDAQQGRRGAGAVGATPPRGAAGPRAAFNFLFGVDPSVPNEDVLGTIPQALFLMNGPIVNRAIGARQGALGTILADNPDNLAALKALYVRVLTRLPNDAEIELCGRHIAALKDRREAFEDVLWSLVNSTEFISRR